MGYISSIVKWKSLPLSPSNKITSLWLLWKGTQMMHGSEFFSDHSGHTPCPCSELLVLGAVWEKQRCSHWCLLNHPVTTSGPLTGLVWGVYAFSLPFLHVRNGADNPRLDTLSTSQQKSLILHVCPPWTDRCSRAHTGRRSLAENDPCSLWKEKEQIRVRNIQALCKRLQRGCVVGPSTQGRVRRGRSGTEDIGTQNLVLKADSSSFGLKVTVVEERGPVIQEERCEGPGGRDTAPSPSHPSVYRKNHKNASYIQLQLRTGDWQNFHFSSSCFNIM